jgi:hypothetical protein
MLMAGFDTDDVEASFCERQPPRVTDPDLIAVAVGNRGYVIAFTIALYDHIELAG